uniref:(California timema) hypothetical protein n=1 Tax=Timema californicum TaxID=61474 RepID=A0A7R9JDW7_TIMCA|nr:unnamed protein product [Timema californicum]
MMPLGFTPQDLKNDVSILRVGVVNQISSAFCMETIEKKYHCPSKYGSCCRRGCRFFNLVYLVENREKVDINATKATCQASSSTSVVSSSSLGGPLSTFCVNDDTLKAESLWSMNKFMGLIRQLITTVDNSEDKKPIDVGTSSLHTVRGAYKTAHNKCECHVHNCLRSLYYLFKDLITSSQVDQTSFHLKCVPSDGWKTQNRRASSRRREAVEEMKKKESEEAHRSKTTLETVNKLEAKKRKLLQQAEEEASALQTEIDSEKKRLRPILASVYSLVDLRCSLLQENEAMDNGDECIQFLSVGLGYETEPHSDYIKPGGETPDKLQFVSVDTSATKPNTADARKRKPTDIDAIALQLKNNEKKPEFSREILYFSNFIASELSLITDERLYIETKHKIQQIVMDAQINQILQKRNKLE